MLQLIYITALLDCMKGKDEIAIVAIKGFKIFVSTYKIIVCPEKFTKETKCSKKISKHYRPIIFLVPTFFKSTAERL